MSPARQHMHIFTLLTISCLISVSTGARQVEVRGKVGGAAELECDVPPLDNSSTSSHLVEWVRQGADVPVLIKFGPYAAHVHPKYEGRASLVRVTALRVEQLRPEDQGLYQCAILLPGKAVAKSRNGTWMLLAVHAPPTFIKVPPAVLETLVGSYVSLTCVASGNPAPSVTWCQDGRVLAKGDEEGALLSVHVVSQQLAGLYVCNAHNSEGNVTHETKLEVKGPPIIVVPPRNTTLNISQAATLQCQAVSNPPNMTYVWQKGGENVHHIESLKSRVRIMVDGTLLISSLIPEDSGNYTCVPSNGLLTPPAASASLTVMHPAQALQMPKQSYLPMGMSGLVVCPARAQPPLIGVHWTKDGRPLDLALYPGWTLTPNGSVLMATVNDDAAGVYTCTPYNSYGSMGSSTPTNVILQDPPSFSVTPETLYKQAAGQPLVIPCHTNNPTDMLTWKQVDSGRRPAYFVAANGSLLLQPLTKDHQGEWECTIENLVASVKTSTTVLVLGTSPHAATSVSISAGATQANVSWVAGFDGGSMQTFSVWVKEISVTDRDGKQAWFSVAVPPALGSEMLVTGLTPSTGYQFSVLSQNRMGTGPFSEIATAWTLDPPARQSGLMLPPSLTASQGSFGVVLKWSPTEPLQPPVTGFVLQFRIDQGEWSDWNEGISANSSEILLQNLQKDCVYELRLLSRRGELLSEPSPSVNVSTMGTGMDMYPTSPRLLKFVSPKLLAGVLGSVAFVCVTLLVLLWLACVAKDRRKRQQREKDGLRPAIYKCSPSIATSGTGSPDSVLKQSLLHARPLYPTTSSTHTTATSSSSSSHTDCSSLNKASHTELQYRRTRPPSGCSRDRLSRTASTPINESTHLELISRGSDGRFSLHGSVLEKRNSRSEFPKAASVRRSTSLCSERESKKDPPFVLSVDLSPCKMVESYCPSPDLSMAEPLPHLRHYTLDQKLDYECYPDISSLCTESICSVVASPHLESPAFPILKGLGQPSTTASTLVLQMEHDRERDNLSRCLKLAKEREELERQLQMYTLGRGTLGDQRMKRKEIGDSELTWKLKSSTLPHRFPHRGKESHTQVRGPLSSSSVQWETQPLVTEVAYQETCFCASPPISPSWTNLDNQHPVKSLTKQPLQSSEEAVGYVMDKSSPPHLPSKHRQHDKMEAALQDFDNSPQSTVFEMQTYDSYSQAGRPNSFCQGMNPALSVQTDKSAETSSFAASAVPTSSHRSHRKHCDTDSAMEMSVDEPDLDVCAMQHASRTMLHQRVAQHLQGVNSRRKAETRSQSLNFRNHALTSCVHRLNAQNSKQRSQSLDSRRPKQSSFFLTPDAWIESLSEENCSYSNQEEFHRPQISTRISKSSVDSPDDQRPPVDPHFENPPDISASSPAFPPAPSDVTPRVQPNRDSKVLPQNLLPHYHDLQSMPSGEATTRAASLTQSGNTYASDGRRDNAGVLELGSNYSSYASSGLGSMEPANGRLSLCISSTRNSSPSAVGDFMENFSPHTHNMELSQRRKLSVDESYEWDAVDVCSRPREHAGLLYQHKQALYCTLPSVQRAEKRQRNYTRHTLLPGHQSGPVSKRQPDSVLF